MRKNIIKGISILLLLSLTSYGEEIFINFNSEEDLKDFKAEQTADRGISKWEIIEEPTAPSGEKAVLVIPNPKTNRGSTFNLLIYKEFVGKDLEISVMVKAYKGNEDQGGGILWRAKDKNNYYVVRWNPLEDNFRLYYVKDGHRRMIASSDFKANPKKWHEIKVIHIGNRIKCYFDGKLKITKKHKLFKNAGYVGLWTKADASTKFDDLKIKEIK